MGLLARGLTSLSDGVSIGYWVSLEPSIRGKNKSDSILDLFLLSPQPLETTSLLSVSKTLPILDVSYKSNQSMWPV